MRRCKQIRPLPVDQDGALPGIVSADDVTGPYDIIVLAEAPGMDELGREVISAIQQIGGITRTLTCPVVHL